MELYDLLTGSVYYFISEWIIRLVMLVYVPQRRSPAAARTWLLFIFVVPWVGLLFYAIVGRPYLPRRRIEMQEGVSELIKDHGREIFGQYAVHPETATMFMQAVHLAENLGDFPIMGGNRFELLADYQGSIDRLVADIKEAQHHVHLLYYIFADDATGAEVVDALGAAARRGVTCRVMVDSLGNKRWRRALAAKLRERQVEVTELLPYGVFLRKAGRMDLRNHRKIAVIDGKIGYVGSQNIVDPKFKEGITYEELVARVTGPLVLQLQIVLLADHFFETEERLEYRNFLPAQDVAGTACSQLLPSGPGYPHANQHRLIVSLIHAAQKRVVMTTPYFIPDDALLQALQTAVLRGVEVHLVMSQKADQMLVGLAQQSFYEDLLESGVQIHLYKKKFLHAKHLSIDDAIVVIGSSNMDIRSFLLNAEISVIIYDTHVAQDLRVIQERYFTRALTLTAEAWRRRSFLKKTAQNVARMVDSLL